MKRYKNALALMKAMPPHLGHLNLIDTAIKHSDHTHVIISYNKNQPIPGEIRFKCIKDIYSHRNDVSVYIFNDEGFPQYDSDCESLDEFYSYWIPAIRNLVGNLDVVFTSEKYGDDFARYLVTSHHIVDIDRIKYPISGTLIRENPFKYWNFIPDSFKSFFVKKIAILGPESTGKTVLSEKISNRFQTNFVPEYGRLVYEAKNGVTLDDFMEISIGRQSLEDWLVSHSNKIIILDTEDIVTYIFSKLYYPEEYKKYEDFFLEKIGRHKYDLYLLFKPDCESIQDGTRNFLSERWIHYKLLKDAMIYFNINFIEIGGNWDERYKKSIEAIKLTFNI